MNKGDTESKRARETKGWGKGGRYQYIQGERGRNTEQEMQRDREGKDREEKQKSFGHISEPQRF